MEGQDQSPPTGDLGGCLLFGGLGGRARVKFTMLYNGQRVDTQKYIIELARVQRLNLTKSEHLMWVKLKNKQILGYKFRCQHPVYRYILDFYCHTGMLAIEIDGDIHKDRKEYDMYRDQFMESIGIKTLRFSASEVFSNVDHVINQIIYVLKKRT